MTAYHPRGWPLTLRERQMLTTLTPAAKRRDTGVRVPGGVGHPRRRRGLRPRQGAPPVPRRPRPDPLRPGQAGASTGEGPERALLHRPGDTRRRRSHRAGPSSPTTPSRRWTSCTTGCAPSSCASPSVAATGVPPAARNGPRCRDGRPLRLGPNVRPEHVVARSAAGVSSWSRRLPSWGLSTRSSGWSRATRPFVAATDPVSGRPLVAYRRWDGAAAVTTPLPDPSPPSAPWAARQRLAGELDRLAAVQTALRSVGLDAMTECEDVAELSGADQHPADMGTETFEREPATSHYWRRSMPRSVTCTGRCSTCRSGPTAGARRAASGFPTHGCRPCRPPVSASPTSSVPRPPRAPLTCADELWPGVPTRPPTPSLGSADQEVTSVHDTVDMQAAQAFLAAGRLAVVGASSDTRQFGNAVYRALRDHGIDVVAVHPTHQDVAGDPAYAELTSVPGHLDGVVVMVGQDRALDVLRDSAGLGIRRAWVGPGPRRARYASATRPWSLLRPPRDSTWSPPAPRCSWSPSGSSSRIHRRARAPVRGGRATPATARPS